MFDSIAAYAAAARTAYNDMTAETVEQAVVVAASTLRVGDECWNGYVKLTVEARRAGNTKTIVKWAERKTEERFEPGEEVTVYRQVETDASKAAREAVYAEYRAARALEELAAEPSRKRLDEALEQNWMERVAGEAVDLHAAQVVAAWASGQAERVAAGKTTAVEAAGLLREYLVERLLQGHDSPAYSGGFSYSNACRQAVQEKTRRAAQVLSRGW